MAEPLDPPNAALDAYLAASLRGEAPGWPGAWTAPAAARGLARRAVFHGIAGLLAEAPAQDWPLAALAALREEALARAMWEARHRSLIQPLLVALAAAGVPALLLKGTALAYDLYSNPATRARGDSDLLVSAAAREGARAVLAAQGFAMQQELSGLDDRFRLQEVWAVTCADGSRHEIDLHWQVLNARPLAALLTVDEVFAQARPLPRLSAEARAPCHADMLLHAIAHRAGHVTAPYFIGQRAHHGGERLIWLKDIDLLARALDAGGWDRFVGQAARHGIGALCADALRAAERHCGTPLPGGVLAALEGAAANTGGAAAAYLGQGSAAVRGWLDWRAVPGWRPRGAYLAARLVPSGAFLRGKYPALRRWPVVLLYLRRLADLFRSRG